MTIQTEKKRKRRWAIEMPPADGDAARAWLLSTKKEKRGNLSWTSDRDGRQLWILVENFGGEFFWGYTVAQPRKHSVTGWLAPWRNKVG